MCCIPLCLCRLRALSFALRRPFGFRILRRLLSSLLLWTLCRGFGLYQSYSFWLRVAISGSRRIGRRFRLARRSRFAKSSWIGRSRLDNCYGGRVCHGEEDSRWWFKCKERGSDPALMGSMTEPQW